MTKNDARELVNNLEAALRDFVSLEEQLKIAPGDPELVMQYKNAAYAAENYKMKMILELI